MARKRKDCCDIRSNSLRDKPVQRNAANARERARMRVLSKAFSRLKTTLPWVPADTKLSKLDTLRLAASYIAHLRQILVDENSHGSCIHPVNLTWPFTFGSSRGPNEEVSTNYSHSDNYHVQHDLMDLDFSSEFGGDLQC